MAKEKYNVSVNNLNPIELKRSRLPDSKIEVIWVNFTSIADNNYNAVHVYDHPHGPHILLSSKSKDRKDFGYVEKIVAEETRGIGEGLITDRNNDICKSITLRKKPTQAVVADFTVSYFKHFKDVKIPVAYFSGVTKRQCERSRIPQEKIKIDDC